MSEALLTVNIDHLVTEDDEPVDNFITEKQERLLTEPLYSSWKREEDKPFLVAANVGVFNSVNLPPVVPDVFLSLDVAVSPNFRKEKKHITYFVWEFGKVPDLVIEIVSNKVGGEDSTKVTRYAQMGVPYYVVFDPLKKLSNNILSFYALQFRRYIPFNQNFFPEIGLGLCLWEGTFEQVSNTWLRWTDEKGILIPSGIECAEAEKQRAEAEKQRAEAEKLRADRLAAKLKELGIDPDSL